MRRLTLFDLACLSLVAVPTAGALLAQHVTTQREGPFFTTLATGIGTALLVLFLIHKENEMADRKQSPTAPGVLRRRAARLVQLGMLVSLEPDDAERPRGYVATVPGGEMFVLQVRDVPPFLTGLAAGHHAAGGAR